jgi:F0F1-type ATP synthase membrane subunit c/vacuolar-type H+-ATPase subunit K
MSAARERTPEEPTGLDREHAAGGGARSARSRRRTLPVAAAILVVLVEAVWLIGVVWLVFRLVARV